MFLNTNFKVPKKLWVQAFSANAFFLCGSNARLRGLISTLESTGSRNQRQRLGKNTARPKEVRCKAASGHPRLNSLKINLVCSSWKIGKVLVWIEENILVSGRYVKYNCDYLLNTNKGLRHLPRN